MDLWAASSGDLVLVSFCVLTLVLGLETGRRQRRTIDEIRDRSEMHARAVAKVRMLEFRAADLLFQVDELERRRDFLIGSGVEVIDLRTALAKGGRHAHDTVVRLSEEAATPDAVEIEAAENDAAAIEVVESVSA
jgi:hypothetical protein